MNEIEQLIEQARAVMVCPACGRSYEAREISFKGLSGHTYVLMTSCANNHPTVYTTWITSYKATLKPDEGAIVTDDVLRLHQRLQQFDGNFRAVWSNSISKRHK